MANAVTIQQRIDYGDGIAAKILGEACTQYRPTDYANAVTSAAAIGTCYARFDPSNDIGAVKPGLYEHPVWIVALNRGAIGAQVGDYLVAASGTYLLIALQALLPTASVLCNRVLTVYRPSASPPSQGFYFGNTANHGDGTPIMIGWPASLLAGTKGERAADNLPADPKDSWAAILLPRSPICALITFGDLAIDDLGRRFTIASIEVSELGYKLTAQYSGS